VEDYIGLAVDANVIAALGTRADSVTSFWVRTHAPLGLRTAYYCRITTKYVPSEFDFRVLGDGRSASARYANNSNYRNDSLIRKESKSIRRICQNVLLIRSVCVSHALIAEIKRIVKESEIMK
jgi:hypothetical protein